MHIDKEKDGFVISMIELETKCKINGIDEKTFAEIAETAKKDVRFQWHWRRSILL